MAQEYDLSSSLTFTGFQPDASRFLSAADLVVSSSIRPEPFSLVCLEAMALGKPVIASAEGGTAEIVQHKATGLLVSPNDPEKLADAMMELLQNESLRLQMGRAGCLRAQQEFSISGMMQSLEKVYLNLIQNHPSN